jgi:secreted PhoX family phosphatase
MQHTRRDFLRLSGLVSLGFLGLDRYALSAPAGVYGDPGYGPLLRNAGGILDLPKGFSCEIISRKGDTMNDGLLVPGMYDGMGAFKWKDNKVLLIRNHELTAGSHQSGPFDLNNALIGKIDKNLVYDFGSGVTTCVGGTTTFIYDEVLRKVELQYLSLTGTIRNCAGGITPWNSWITCEEINNRTGDFNGTLEKDHGYNFEVPATDTIGLTEPHPLKAMGRFVHEAVTVHPDTGIVYQTEDTGNSIFYRYLPNSPGALHKGGKLQCLVLTDWKGVDTRNWVNSTDNFPAKKLFNTEWIDLDNVESPDNDLRLRGAKMGAATFANAEGIWYGNKELFFACTAGGKNSKGQIFRYIPSPYEGQPREKEQPGQLELFIEPNDIQMFQNCDNLTIAPWGDVIICEDKSDPRIMGITPKGQIYPIAKNIGYRSSEFAGPVFSPSGKTLFINIQNPGLTLAITGPWISKA